MEAKPAWEGKVTAAIRGAGADEAWSLLKDFCILHRWVASIEVCRKLEGVDGEPGCVRYCGGPVNRSDPTQRIGWSKERLVAVDPAARSYTYEVVETNKGFGRYRATIGIAAPDAAVGPGGCCQLEWSFESDPVKGWSEEEFVAYLGKLAQGVAARLEEEIGAGACVERETTCGTTNSSKNINKQ